MTTITWHEIETQIDGFDVTLTVDDGVSTCVVRCGRYAGTLDFIEEYGILVAQMSDYELMVPKKTIKEIVAWAESEGYQ
jgi:hypothetical protein